MLVKKGIREKGGQGFMGKKLVTIVAAFVFFGSLFVLQGVFGQQDSFTIDNPGLYTTDKYQGAPINHKKHADESVNDCTKCHHTYKEGEKVKKCVDCHTKDSKIPAKKAFHDNCRNCHRKYKKEGKPTGPTVCTKCHAKK
jgi:hypothetical protein